MSETVLTNGTVTLRISSLGAEMQSAVYGGREYLWQGDPEFWEDRAPNIFPYVARLYGGKYQYRGKEYSLPIHGFIPTTELRARRMSDGCAEFSVASDGKTLGMYPFEFKYSVRYSLSDRTVFVTVRIENYSDETMYFGMGGHPGFNVPMDDGLSFEDYNISFENTCPLRVGFTDTCFRNGKYTQMNLPEGKLYLRHDLFDHDAIVLHGAGHSAVISSEKGEHSVSVHFPGMEYVGIWHAVKKPAPYVCIEPWASLPAHDGITEDLEKQRDLKPLAPAGIYVNKWDFTLS